MTLFQYRLHGSAVLVTFVLTSLIGISATAAVKPGTNSFVDTSAYSPEFFSLPPFLERETGKPSVIVSLDVSDAMLDPAYALNDFDPNTTYPGYFDSTRKYRYDTVTGVFEVNANLTETDPQAWDGNFLNWLTMRRIDLARHALVGGKVRNRTVSGNNPFVLEGEVEQGSGHAFQKSDADSGDYSPIPDGAVVSVSNGKIWVSQSGMVTPVSEQFEVGVINTGQWGAELRDHPEQWPQVNFHNEYTNPIVVVTALTSNDAEGVVPRAYDVSSAGFRIGMQEWDSLDGEHLPEQLLYMVAEENTLTDSFYDIELTSGVPLRIVAGRRVTSAVLRENSEPSDDPDFEQVSFVPGTFMQTPLVFAGVSTMNASQQEISERVVSARVFATTDAGFNLALQEENGADGVHHPQSIHYIAMSPISGVTEDGTVLALGRLDDVTSTGRQLAFSAGFSVPPFVNLTPQTLNDRSAISVRAESPWSLSQMQVRVQESDASSHGAESLAWLAVTGQQGMNIAVARATEPQGLIQTKAAEINFGLSVFNFDHKLNTLDVLLENNQVNGQTMHPCYYIFDEPRQDRRHDEADTDPNSEVSTVTLYNGESRDYLCIPTGVHAPNDKIVQVIEEHPMIGGEAPLAEALVDMGRYVSQVAPQYPNVNSSNSVQAHTLANSPQAVYGTGEDWDPFFDTTQDQTMECKKVFMLHVGAGEISGDGPVDAEELVAIADESHSENEVLDNVAMALRQNDCRNDLPNHQELISYFVYLGQDTNTDAARRLREAAARGGFLDMDDDHVPDPLKPEGVANFNEYAEKNTTPGLPNVTACPANEWDRNSDCEPDAFLPVSDLGTLSTKLAGALSDITARGASGGGASVVANTVAGEGVLYQASFYPSRSQNGDTVRWTGDVSALMIDENGYLRSDGNGDLSLGEFSDDPIVDTCFDSALHTVRVALSTDPVNRPTQSETIACRPVGKYSSSLSDIGYVWSAADELADLTSVHQQRAFDAVSPGRYILTDADGNGTTEAFLASAFAGRHGVLDAADADMAANIVNFVRGQALEGMRSRQLGSSTLRLGDIVHSSPTAVGKPPENLHLLYDDASYLDFYRQYRNRRTMVYVGANDGMLHAFNAGSYNRATSTFETDTWTLGQEVWAYVPYNLLPHLRQLTLPEYGQRDGDHLFMVDQSPYVFDARIFADDDTHPNGWGTVLVVGFRTGGGAVKVYPDPADLSEEETMRPAYLIFDVTDPEQPPVLLAEFSHEKLGMSFPEPTALTVKNSTGSLDWYLAFGSGPSATPNGVRQVVSEQNAHLFMYNLKTKVLESSFGTQGVMDLGETTSFVGDIAAADFDLDATTDALYFGTTRGVDNLGSDGLAGSDGVLEWSGKLMRTRIQSGTNSSSHAWKSEVMFDALRPIPYRPSISFDRNLNRWIHIGTGRLFTAADSVDDSVQSLFGLKEPRDTDDGSFQMDTYSATVAPISMSDLVDVSGSEVEAATGNLDGSVSLSPALDSDTVAALEQRMMRYSDSAENVAGWRKELEPGERAMGAARIFGGILSQSTYLPQLVPCSFVGEAFLYALRYTTGTAGALTVLSDPVLVNEKVVVVEKVQVGTSPTLTPAIHLGKTRESGEATLININSDMSITTTTERNLDGIDSREISWRGL